MDLFWLLKVKVHRILFSLPLLTLGPVTPVPRGLEGPQLEVRAEVLGGEEPDLALPGAEEGEEMNGVVAPGRGRKDRQPLSQLAPLKGKVPDHIEAHPGRGVLAEAGGDVAAPQLGVECPIHLWMIGSLFLPLKHHSKHSKHHRFKVVIQGQVML